MCGISLPVTSTSIGIVTDFDAQLGMTNMQNVLHTSGNPLDLLLFVTETVVDAAASTEHGVKAVHDVCQ